MKYTLLFILIAFALTEKQRLRSDCVSLGCICVSTEMSYVIRPYCPNTAVNECYAKTKCEKQRKSGECGFTETEEVSSCLAKAEAPVDQPTEIKRAECVSYGCVCVGSNVNFIQAPQCPNKAVNECYARTQCEKQVDGECGYTESEELKKCLANAEASDSVPIESIREMPKRDCVSYDCVCVGSNVNFFAAPYCPNKAANECYAKAQCEKQKKTDECGYTESEELTKCLANAEQPEATVLPAPEPEKPVEKQCMIGGCSGEICSDEPTMSMCMYDPKFACYKGATCAVQGDGNCGWTMSEELKICLDQH
jgi:hypothetical protein